MVSYYSLGSSFDNAIFRLGLHAFHQVLSRRSSRYTFIVRWLELEIMQPKYKRYRREFESLVKEGEADLAQITT